MKRLLAILLVLSFIPFATSQTPEHDYTKVYTGDAAQGEGIVLGVQYSEDVEVDFAEAELYNAGETVDSAVLIDRDGDNYYGGALEGMKAWNDYRLVIKACNSEGCSEEVRYKEANLVDWEDFGSRDRPGLPN